MVDLGLWSVGKGTFWTRSVRLCMQMFGMMSLQYFRMMKLRAFINPINGSSNLITGYIKRKKWYDGRVLMRTAV